MTFFFFYDSVTCNGDNDTRDADTEHLAGLLQGYFAMDAETQTESRQIRQAKATFWGADVTQLIKEKRMKNRGGTNGENKKYVYSVTWFQIDAFYWLHLKKSVEWKQSWNQEQFNCFWKSPSDQQVWDQDENKDCWGQDETWTT